MQYAVRLSAVKQARTRPDACVSPVPLLSSGMISGGGNWELNYARKVGLEPSDVGNGETGSSETDGDATGTAEEVISTSGLIYWENFDVCFGNSIEIIKFKVSVPATLCHAISGSVSVRTGPSRLWDPIIGPNILFNTLLVNVIVFIYSPLKEGICGSGYGEYTFIYGKGKVKLTLCLRN
jgi:hypothetical protein